MAVVGSAEIIITPNTAGFRRELTSKTNKAAKDAAKGAAAAFTGAALGVTIIQGLRGIINASLNFETAFAGVRKTVDATEEQFSELARGIVAMSKAIPATTTEISAVAEAAGQLGIARQDILAFTRVIIDLGNTTNLSAEQAADSLARFVNIVGGSQGDFSRLGSAIVDLGNKFASTEAEILDFATRVAGAGKVSRLAPSAILGISTAFSSVGVEAERGGTAVQKVLLGMVTASQTGGKALAKFGQVAGTSAKGFKALFEKDAAEAFVRFVEGLGREGQGAIKTLKALGLTDSRLTSAFLGLASAGDLARRAVHEGAVAFEADSALTEEASKRYATAASQFKILGGRVVDLARSLGNALVPAVIAVSTALLGFVDLLGTAPGKTLLLVSAVIALRKAAQLLAATSFGNLAFQQGVMFALTDTARTLGLRLTTLAKAVTPLRAAFALAAFALIKFLDRKKDAIATSKAFADAIKAEADGLKGATREAVAKQLADRGALELADRYGFALERLTDAALGDADALKLLATGVEAFNRAQQGFTGGELGGKAQNAASEVRKLDHIVRFLNASLGGGKITTEQLTRAMTGTAGALATAMPPANAFAAAMKRVADEGARVKSKTDAARDALDSLLGPALTAEEAADNFTTKIRALGEALKGSKSGLRGNSEAALAAREALREAVRGAQDLAAGTGSTRGALIAQIRAMQTLSNTSPQVAAKLAPLIAKLKALVKVPTVDKAAAAKAGADIAAGIAAGMKSGQANVEHRARQLAAAAIAAARAKLETGSPSKVFKRIGQNIVEGLVEGIKGKSGMSLASIKALFDKLKEQAQSMRDSIAQGIGGGTDIVSSLGGVSMLGGDNVNAFFQQAIAKAKEFGARLRQLAKAGLNQGLLQRLASAGPDALPLIRAIQQAGVGRISSFQNQIDNIINRTGRAVAPFPTLGVSGAGGTIRVEVILNEKVLGVAIAELDRKNKRGRR